VRHRRRWGRLPRVVGVGAGATAAAAADRVVPPGAEAGAGWRVSIGIVFCWRGAGEQEGARGQHSRRRDWARGPRLGGLDRSGRQLQDARLVGELSSGSVFELLQVCAVWREGGRATKDGKSSLSPWEGREGLSCRDKSGLHRAPPHHHKHRPLSPSSRPTTHSYHLSTQTRVRAANS